MPPTPEPEEQEETRDETDVEEGEDTRAIEIARLRRYASKGKHLKRPFTSDILTPLEISGVIAEEVGKASDAPFRDSWEGYP